MSLDKYGYLMYLRELEDRIIKNKKRRGFNLTSLSHDIVLLMEEVGELCRAYRDGDDKKFADAIGDISAYLIGIAHMKGLEFGLILDQVVEANETREHRNNGLNPEA